MAITIEKLDRDYEYFSTMDGYCLCEPNGTHKWFVTYSRLKEYCEKNGIKLED